MSWGWYWNEPLVLLLVPKLMTRLQELGHILERGDSVRSRWRLSRRKLRKKTVVVVPPVEGGSAWGGGGYKGGGGTGTETGVDVGSVGLEPFFGNIRCAGILDLNFQRDPKTCVTVRNTLP